MERKSINFVRCLKCQKILQCSRYDASALLQHIRDDHPEIEIVNNGTKKKPHTNGQRPQAVVEGESAGPNNKTTNRTNVQTRAAENLKLDTAHGKLQTTKDLTSDHDLNVECKCTNDQKSRGVTVNPNYEMTARRNFDKSEGIGYNPDTVIEGYQGTPADREESGHPYYIPEEDLTRYSITSELLAKYPEIKKSEFCPRDPDAKVIYTRRYKIKTPSTTASTTTTTFTRGSRTPRKRRFYRTSIEKWRPAHGTIYCPKCGSCNRPLIKKKTEHFTQNECWACFLLSCWPLCFIPCLLPGKDVEYLHCSNCQTFLGVYNRSLNCIKPNRDFMANATRKDIKLKNSIESSEALPKSTSVRSNSSHLPSIVIDGKELHPKMVARLQRYKKFGSWAGIDLENLISDDEEAHSKDGVDYKDSFRDGIPDKQAPSAGNKSNNKSFS